MSTLGFTEENRSELMKILAGILLLGNIDFVGQEKHGQLHMEVGDKQGCSLQA